MKRLLNSVAWGFALSAIIVGTGTACNTPASTSSPPSVELTTLPQGGGATSPKVPITAAPAPVSQPSSLPAPVATPSSGSGILHLSGAKMGGYVPNEPDAQWRVVGALEADGKILLAASIDNGLAYYNSRLGLYRFMPDGTLDSTFGSQGGVQLQIGRAVMPEQILFQADGRILIVGTASDEDAQHGPIYRPIAMRLTNLGAPDLSYGTQGLLSFVIPGENNSGGVSGISADLDSKGQLLLAIVSNGARRSHLFRFLTDGTLDPSFASNSLTELPFVSGQWIVGIKVEAQKNGGTLVAAAPASGSTPSVTKYRPLIVRLDSGGRLDFNFLATLLSTETNWGASPGFDFDQTTDGKIAIDDEDGGFARILPDGNPDFAAPTIKYSGARIFVQKDGTYFFSYPKYGGVNHFLGDGNLDPNFGISQATNGTAGKIYDDQTCSTPNSPVDGQPTCQIHSAWIGQDQAGRSIFIGTETHADDSSLTPTFRISRYFANGLPDVGFGGSRSLPAPAPIFEQLNAGFPHSGQQIVQKGTVDFSHGFGGASPLSIPRVTMIASDTTSFYVVAAGGSEFDKRNSLVIHRISQAGDEDPTFNPVRIQLGDPNVAGQEVVRSLTFRPDGSILVASESQDSQVGGGALPRWIYLSLFDSKGRPVQSFGQNGALNVPQLDAPFIYEYVEHLVLDGKGRILLAYRACGQDGSLYFGQCKAFVRRYDPSGKPDRNFGSHGVASVGSVDNTPTWPGPETSLVYGPFVGTNGALQFAWNDPSGVRVLQLKDNGTIDSGFSGHGSALVAWPGSEKCSIDDALSGDGGRVTFALACADGVSLARALPTGVPDPAFAQGGLLKTGLDLGKLPDPCHWTLRSPARITFPSTGGIWVASIQLPEKVTCFNGPILSEQTSSRLTVKGFTANGLIDSGFGTLGTTEIDLAYHFLDPTYAQIPITFLPGDEESIAVMSNLWATGSGWITLFK